MWSLLTKELWYDKSLFECFEFEIRPSCYVRSTYYGTWLTWNGLEWLTMQEPSDDSSSSFMSFIVLSYRRLLSWSGPMFKVCCTWAVSFNNKLEKCTEFVNKRHKVNCKDCLIPLDLYNYITALVLSHKIRPIKGQIPRLY